MDLMDVPPACGWLSWAPFVAQGEKQSQISDKAHYSPLYTLPCWVPHLRGPTRIILFWYIILLYSLSTNEKQFCGKCNGRKALELHDYHVFDDILQNFFDSFSKALTVHTKAKSQSHSLGHRYFLSPHFPHLFIHSVAHFSAIPSLAGS